MSNEIQPTRVYPIGKKTGFPFFGKRGYSVHFNNGQSIDVGPMRNHREAIKKALGDLEILNSK